MLARRCPNYFAGYVDDDGPGSAGADVNSQKHLRMHCHPWLTRPAPLTLTKRENANTNPRNSRTKITQNYKY